MRRYIATPFSIVYALFDLVQAMLLLRFALKFLGANPGQRLIAGFYSLTDPLVAPFRGIFADAVSGATRIEWAGLVAVIAYAVFAMILVRIFDLLVTGMQEDEHVHHRHA